MVTTQCHSIADLELHSDETLWASADIVEASFHNMRRKCDFEEDQRIHGLTYNPEGVLWDTELRRYVKPISTSVNDWCHVFLVQGIAQTELWAYAEQFAHHQRPVQNVITAAFPTLTLTYLLLIRGN